MVRTIVSVVWSVPSSTRRVSVISVSSATEGAVISGVAKVRLSKDMTGVAGDCDHKYVRSLSLPSGFRA